MFVVTKFTRIAFLFTLIGLVSTIALPVAAEEEEVAPTVLFAESATCMNTQGRDICTYGTTNNTLDNVQGVVIETEEGLTITWDQCGRLAQPIAPDESVSCSVIVSGDREWAPEVETIQSAAEVAVGDTFIVNVAASDLISPTFYLGIGELILAEMQPDGEMFLSESIGAVEPVSAEIDPEDGESVNFVVRVVNNDFRVGLSSFVHADTLRDGQIGFTSMSGGSVRVDVVEPTIIDPIDDFESTIDEQIDYSEWYEMAAEIIGVTVDDLTSSEESIRTIAMDNGLRSRDVSSPIYWAERVEMKRLRDAGIISSTTYRERRRDVRLAAKAFVNTEPAELSTDTSAQEAFWSEWELDTYTYTLQTSCFCIGLLDYTISVVDDVVVNVSAVPSNPDDIAFEEETGNSYDPNPDPSDFRTLNDWYTYIADKQATEPYLLSVRYDALLGYPTSIYSDDHPMIADEEIGYTITLIE